MPNTLSPLLLDLGQGGYRLIMVPDDVAQHATDYQMQFGKWLSAPEAGHGDWTTGPDGTPALCYEGGGGLCQLAEHLCAAAG